MKLGSSHSPFVLHNLVAIPILGMDVSMSVCVYVILPVSGSGHNCLSTCPDSVALQTTFSTNSLGHTPSTVHRSVTF